MISVVAFEGPDKVGKSTLIRNVNRATDYRYLCIDRFLASAWVYDSLTERRDREAELLAAERELGQAACLGVVNVLVTCDRDILAGRIQREDEEPEARLQNLDRMIELYDRYTEITKLPFIKIDTTHVPVEESVHQVTEGLRAYDLA